MVLAYWAEKVAEEAKKREQYETHAERMRAIKEAQHNIHTENSSSTPDTLTSDSGQLEYNDFKQKKISSHIIVELNEKEKEEMRRFKKKENRADFVRKK